MWCSKCGFTAHYEVHSRKNQRKFGGFITRYHCTYCYLVHHIRNGLKQRFRRKTYTIFEIINLKEF